MQIIFCNPLVKKIIKLQIADCCNRKAKALTTLILYIAFVLEYLFEGNG